MELFISDLDGTLLNGNAEVTEFTRDTLNRLMAKGLNFTAATARTLASAPPASNSMRNKARSGSGTTLRKLTGIRMASSPSAGTGQSFPRSIRGRYSPPWQVRRGKDQHSAGACEQIFPVAVQERQDSPRLPGLRVVLEDSGGKAAERLDLTRCVGLNHFTPPRSIF